MGYEEIWKVLADLITDLRKSGESVPTKVMKDLRSAKTMIQILKTDQTHVENLPRIEMYLGDLESYLIFSAQQKFGSSYVDQWLKKLERARKEICEEGKPGVSRFVPGLPRSGRWVRIKVYDEIPQKDIERLAEENKLLCKMQANGYLLVCGDVEKIKAFVVQMKENFSKRD